MVVGAAVVLPAVQAAPVKLLLGWYCPPGHGAQVSVVAEPLPRKFPALQEVEWAVHFASGGNSLSLTTTLGLCVPAPHGEYAQVTPWSGSSVRLTHAPVKGDTVHGESEHVLRDKVPYAAAPLFEEVSQSYK